MLSGYTPFDSAELACGDFSADDKISEKDLSAQVIEMMHSGVVYHRFLFLCMGV